jgi:hypothetical protein
MDRRRGRIRRGNGKKEGKNKKREWTEGGEE